MGRGGLSRRGFLLGSAALTSGAVLIGSEGNLAHAAAAPERAAGTPPEPPVIACDDWGARPNSRVVEVQSTRPDKILVHHTADPNSTDLSLAAATKIARDIQNFHMDRRGWIDSGQHFTISRGGFVLEGRRRSLEAVRTGRQHVVGSHCTGQNEVAVGIENEGTYGSTIPPTAQWVRLREMCAYVCGRYGIEPTEIYGHRDHRDTACPGDRLYRLLPQLRVDVAALLNMSLTLAQAVHPAWPLLRTGARGPTVAAAQHLLRGAGITDVVPDGLFGRSTTDAVRRFQTEHRTEEINGYLGGESWPLLTRDVRVDTTGTGAPAVRALLSNRTRPVQPGDGRQWQRLLGTVG